MRLTAFDIVMDGDAERETLRRRRQGFDISWCCLLGVALALASASVAGRDEGSPCDPSLHGAPGHPYAYRTRGNRCEGVYARPVASTTLTVVSLTAAFDDYRLESTAPLAIKWSPRESAAAPAAACGMTGAGGAAPVHVRAQSLQPRVYYRMDTIRPFADHDYDWPKETLGALAIPRAGLGVLGWTTRAVDGAERAVYLPLRIAQAPATAQATAADYRVLVVPGRELEEVYVTLARFEDSAQPAAWLRRGEKLGYGYYPAERPIRIPLPLAGNPGCYRLEITATLSGGGTTATALWLYDAWP